MDRGAGGWLALLTASSMALGCAKPTPERRQASAQPTSKLAPSASTPAPSASGASPSASTQPGTPQAVLAEWTRALNSNDLAALERLYADRVRFYGQSLTRAQVIESKRKALAATPTFTQSVLNAPSVEQKGDAIHVAFHKRSGRKDAQHDVLATLVLASGPPLLIQEETDVATEKRLRPAAARAAVPEDCDSAVWFLADSTSEAARIFKKIDESLREFPDEAELHPGGMGPFTPQENGDGTYSVSIGVHHPERFEAYAWFSIAPTGKVTVSASSLNLDDAPVKPAPEAVQHFLRLCGSR